MALLWLFTNSAAKLSSGYTRWKRKLEEFWSYIFNSNSLVVWLLSPVCFVWSFHTDVRFHRLQAQASHNHHHLSGLDPAPI